MKRGGLDSNRVRLAAVIGAGAIALATAGPVAAKDPLAPSKTCRKTIAGEMGKLAGLTNTLIDKCHKTQMKLGASRTNCNVIDSVEMDPPVLPKYPVGKYDVYKQKAHDKIALKCFPGDPELGNFQSEDAFARLLPIIEGETAALGVSIISDDTILATDKDTQKCVNTVAKWRSKIFAEVIKDSNKAQKLTDKTATVFGRMVETNMDTGDKNTPLAVVAIPPVCAAVVGTDSCKNETTCLDATRTAAQKLTRELYHGKNTCEPSIGTRTVEITINTPENLAGMKVDLDYPQFQTGLVGTEQSLLVSDAVALTHTDPGMFKVVNDRETDMSIVVGSTNAFIQNGDKVTVTFDSCGAKERNMCNRSQQVVDCTISGNICNGGSRAGNICTQDATSGTNVCSAGSRRGLACTTATTGGSSECPGGAAGGGNSPCFPGFCPGATCPGCCVPETFEANPDVCTYPSPLDTYPDGLITGVPGGCCPGDNACIPQFSSTTCSVTDPVRANGTNVAGVTCSLTISGT